MDNRMELLLQEALAHYEFREPQSEFIRHNENATYKLTDAITLRQYVLRIHQSSDSFSLEVFGLQQHRVELLESEMQILLRIGECTDIPVQRPVRNRDGQLVTRLGDGTWVTVLTWISGETMEKTEMTEQVLFQIGEMAGKLHRCFRTWTDMPADLTRYRYDAALLQNVRARLKTAVSAGFIQAAHDGLLQAAMDEIGLRVKALDLLPDTRGIAHTDLSKSNMIVIDSGIAPIDFGLCGFSHSYMDLGSLFSHFTKTEERRMLLYGYRTLLSDRIEARFIEPFMALQILLFIASHYEKALEWDWFDDAMQRWGRETFRPLAAKEPFLAGLDI